MTALLDEQDQLALAGVRTLRSCAEPLDALLRPDALIVSLSEAGLRGFFRPNEDELLREWFARFLNLRHALWEVLERSVVALGGKAPLTARVGPLRLFIVGYCAAAQVVRLDRYLVEELADASEIQRKLNEEDARYGIARKQFTRVFESLSDPQQALQMRKAIRFVETKRSQIAALAKDPIVGSLVSDLHSYESYVETSARHFLHLAARFAQHAFARRGASARQRAAFAVLESGGRVVSELRDQWTPKRVAPEVREQCTHLMAPGDVLVTRHRAAFTNLFLPGYWPHAALVLGTHEQLDELGVRRPQSADWPSGALTLEALKDGVRVRAIAQTLAVDAFVLLRPALPATHLARGLERALTHEGKDYNFDFDFFRSDKLVCTEVIYRAFDGVAGFELPLQVRAGRHALTAEDLLDLAVDTPRFEVIAIFGSPGCDDRLAHGDEARSLLEASYRGGPPIETDADTGAL